MPFVWPRLGAALSRDLTVQAAPPRLEEEVANHDYEQDNHDQDQDPYCRTVALFLLYDLVRKDRLVKVPLY